MSTERIDVAFGAQISGLLSGLGEATAGVKEAVEGMKAQFEGLNAAAGSLMAPFVAITALLGGGEMFEHLIETAAQAGASLEVLGQKTGETAEDLSRLQFAAEQSHVGAGALDTGLTRLARSMQGAASGTGAAADAFRAMGISVKDNEGNLRPLREVLLDVADKFKSYEDGAAKSALAMNIFGRSGADLVPLLNQGRDGIADLTMESDRLGATWSEQQKGVAVEYEDAMKRVHAESSSYGRTVAIAIMPALTALADSFTKSAGGAGLLDVVTEALAGTFRFLGSVVIGVKYLVVGTFDEIKGVLTLVGDAIGNLAAAVDLAVHGHFQEAKTAAKQFGSDIVVDWKERTKAMETNAQEAKDAIARIFGFSDDASSAGGAKGEGKKTAAPGSIKGPADSKELAQFQEEWLQIKDGSTANKDALLELERDFWTQKLALLDTKAKNYAANYRAIQAKIVSDDVKLSEDQKRAALIAGQVERDTQLASLDVDRQAIEERRAMHDISASEALAQLKAVSDQSFQIKLDENRDEWALADGDVVKQAELDARREALVRAHQQEIARITKDAMHEQYAERLEGFRMQEALDKDHLDKVLKDRQDELAYIRQHYGEMSKEVQDGVARVMEAQNAVLHQSAREWESVFNVITNSVKTTFDAVIRGTLTLKQGFAEMFRSITLSAISSGFDQIKAHAAMWMAKKEITTNAAGEEVAMGHWAAIQSVASDAWSSAQHAAHWIQRNAMTAAGTAKDVALHSWAAIQSVAKSAWAALINIGNYAAEAIAGTWAAISSIPFVGPFLAPAMAAGAGVAVLSLAGRVSSAAGGFDIPAGVNPMTQLHAQEMVLPAELANRVRSMSGGGSGGDTHVHLNVQAWDSRDVKKFLMDNSDAVVDATVRGVKDGRHTRGRL